uniref:Uncharacterized protein n=2 Tax=Aegilops tauschii subsp. strangulata TaxID=200361 RepID=A0A453CE33_AEGTS
MAPDVPPNRAERSGTTHLAPCLLHPEQQQGCPLAVPPSTSDERRRTWQPAPSPMPETLAMGGGGRGWDLVASSVGSSRMGGRRGARRARVVLRGGGIRRASPESAVAGGAARSSVKREMGGERDGRVGDATDTAASGAARWVERRGRAAGEVGRRRKRRWWVAVRWEG